MATISIKMLGDKDLQRMLNKLPDKVQKKVVRPAFRKSAKRINEAMIQRLSGFPVGVVTGQTLLAFAAEPVISVRLRGGEGIQYAARLPKRDALGISPDDKYYYPNAIEYGYTTKGGRTEPPRSFMRAAVDENEDRELGVIRHDLRRGIELEARKLGKPKR